MRKIILAATLAASGLALTACEAAPEEETPVTEEIIVMDETVDSDAEVDEGETPEMTEDETV